MKKYLFFSAVIILLLSSKSFSQSHSNVPSFISDSLDSYIRKGMKDWNIPGLAITIVKDGKVVVRKGYGVTDIKTQEPVDENTLFMIASNTKLFTGTALAQLDYNKKLSLDDKVSKHIKSFTLFDKNSSDLVTIRDLLSHRIGTKTFQGDFTFWNSNLSRQQIIYKMRLLKPAGLFRQDYGYCNSCFVTAGEVIPVVSRKPWEVYIYDSLLIPLGMTNTHTLSQGIDERKNAAKPYNNLYTGKLTELPYDNIDNLGAAGSMVSNVKDLSRWLIAQLDSGRLDDKTVLPWAVIQKTRDMNLPVGSRKSAVYPMHFRGYGLGVFMADYNGRQVYYHTGGAFGFVTNTCFVPEEKLGISILTNNDNQEFFEALRYQILDAYLNVPYVDRSKQRLPGFQKEWTRTLDEVNKLKARVDGNAPPLSLEAYVGNYTNDVYGNIVIEKDKSGKGFIINFKGHNRLTAKLDYMDNEEWLLSYNNIGYGVFPTKFKIDNKKVSSVEIKVNEFLEQDPYTFIKK